LRPIKTRVSLSHVLGYGQLLVLDESLTVLLVLFDIIEIALCVIVLSEINNDDKRFDIQLIRT